MAAAKNGWLYIYAPAIDAPTIFMPYTFNKYARKVPPTTINKRLLMADDEKLCQLISLNSDKPNGSTIKKPNVNTQRITLIGLYCCINGFTKIK